ncbi:uncharacterized protein N7498_008746 [Penicillium cinerascens]|uniref:Apple domain-containing protein n=1 Tax=Penicillium cinerascens TaxID=70096 RepID=A0A9W9MAZ3_9EURO|nr:uncharacterized protein N7498_008746 [Penicillium cinerascens]KAJ5195308.1 hypothetical protein N7498_008746 [Penicillium cinerascens]
MMKTAPFWASIALLVPRALATSPTSTSTSTTSTSAAPSCTASLIAKLCNYPEPQDDFAVASSGTADCWDYCNANPPCSFVIFVAGNPYTGTGTCWLYPGENYDASQGSSNCGNPYLSVFNKPVCSGGSATTTSGACAATATPSAITSVCGYPAPSDSFDNCYASSGASNCLSICAEADACSYAVFNTHNDDNSQYSSGTCWVYPNGTFNAASATTCSGDPYQFVYNNVCPKPSSSSSSLSSSATGHSGGTGTAGTNAGSTVSNAKGSITSNDKNSTTSNAKGSTTTSKNSAPTGLSLSNPLAIGGAMLLLQAL